MHDRSVHVLFRGALWLAAACVVMVFIGHAVRPDLPIAARAARMVTDTMPFMDGVFRWFWT